MGLPHAQYFLAEFNGVRGVSSPNFVPAGGRLVLGNELINPVAAHATADRQARKHAHTVRRISALIRQPVIKPPLNWTLPAGIEGTGGVMTGYLLLDALVGNQDRHEENWGLIVLRGQIYLAPTFDHASSLGRNEKDSVRTAKLAASDPAHGLVGYSRRAKSQIFDGKGERLTTRVALSEFGEVFPRSLQHWLAHLRNMDENFFWDVLNRVPADWITAPAREFAVRLLEVNRESLLELTR